MALLKFFRKLFGNTSPSVTLEQTSYDIAYFILPPTVHENFDAFKTVFDRDEKIGNAFYYLMACQARGVSPDPNAAMRYSWHHGELNDTWRYHILSYPDPPPVSIDPDDFSAMLDAAKKITLAPYFSAILYAENEKPQYYVLGQTSIGGGSTLRSVTSDGTNCNLGPGPDPDFDLFLEAVREQITEK